MRNLLVSSVSIAVLALGCASNIDHPVKKSDSGINVQDVESGVSGLNQFLDSVSGRSTFSYLVDLDFIGRQYGGNRTAGTSGYKASLDYLEPLLIKKGYKVWREVFNFTMYEQKSANFSQTTPTKIQFEDEKDYNVQTFSPSGRLEGNIQAVDLDLGPGNTSTSGCESEDFDAFVAGKIALIQRGACSFRQKATNAQNAGASAVVIFNQGNESTREDLFGGTLGAPEDVEVELTIPVVSIPYSLGVSLNETEGVALSIDVQTELTPSVSENLLAETPGGNPDNVVMLGSHLDSVEKGNGINDNGSGSAGILEVALKFPNIHDLNNKLRFAWWGAEELGLIGSRKYVAALTQEEQDKISMYLNFDMIASPNYMLGVFDGDGSEWGLRGPSRNEDVESSGSASIEYMLTNFLSEDAGVPVVQTEISGRSDYAGFQEVGIPFGGLFTGAEGEKSLEMAAAYGGVAGKAFDECYHQACDTYQNISIEALEQNVRVIAYAAMIYSQSTATVEGAIEVPRKTENELKGAVVVSQGHKHNFK